jgi:hypothetical protein
VSSSGLVRSARLQVAATAAAAESGGGCAYVPSRKFVGAIDGCIATAVDARSACSRLPGSAVEAVPPPVAKRTSPSSSRRGGLLRLAQLSRVLLRN